MHSILGLAFTASCLISNVFAGTLPARLEKRAGAIKPKVFIISMFDPEAEVWYGISDFDVLAMNVTVPGFSPIYPDAHCTANGEVCQLTIGESGMYIHPNILSQCLTSETEINAASSVSALALSPQFDLTTTYFMVAGIAGVNPEEATICSVTFARYAVQVGLQCEYKLDPFLR